MNLLDGADHLIVPSFRSLSFSLDNNPKLGYLPALDGLRALAILTVMAYHFRSKPLFPGGGIIGVDLFFVLSGFLITTLLLQEWARFGEVSLKRFYQRRVLRLLPALALFLTVYLAVTFGFRSFEFTGESSTGLILANLASVATYTYNWVSALGGRTILGFSHLWSLSIEEQFYIVWPFVLLALLRLKTSPAALLAISIGILASSALLPFLLDEPRNRFYFGTDYRLQTLMLGCVLAQLYVSGALKQGFTQLLPYRLGLAASILFLAATALLATNRTTFLFLGGHTGVAISGGFLVVGCMFQQRSPLTAVLSNPVLVYIGQRSYALYLWHLAIGSWLRTLDPVPHVMVALVLSIIAAELSYRLVEEPALSLKSRIARPQSETQQPLTAAGPETSPSAAA